MPPSDAGPLRVSEPAAAYAVDAPPVIAPFPYGSPGRPSKYTPETLTKLFQAIADGNKIRTACQLAGINYDTYSEWRKSSDAGDPRFDGFSERVDEAQGLAEQELLSTIKTAAQQDWKAAGWIMARRFGWVDESRLTVDHTGTVTSNIEITVLTSNDLGGIAGLLGTPGTPGHLIEGTIVPPDEETT